MLTNSRNNFYVPDIKQGDMGREENLTLLAH